ncbi:MAG: hypothetical protein RH862_16845 [Leptospiraceae bacterium]
MQAYVILRCEHVGIFPSPGLRMRSNFCTGDLPVHSNFEMRIIRDHNSYSNARNER